MESLLEQHRRLHEEKERLEDTLVKEMLAKKATHREQLNSEHRLKYLLDRHHLTTNNLIDMYEDTDKTREEEVRQMSGPNEFSEFYKRMKAIKEHYKSLPNEVAIPMSSEFDEFLKSRENPSESNLVEFSDEEGYGKFLDLNECFQKYLNLKGVLRIDYLTYLSIFDRLFEISKDKKLQLDYKRYLESLLDYLSEFCGKVKPLLNLEDQLERAVIEMNDKWESGTFPGWAKEAGSALAHSGAVLDLSGFNSWEELASLGLDRLKSALMASGMKCGGTLEERAKRLWSTKGVSLENLDPNLFVSTKGKNSTKDQEKQREIGALEAQVYKLAEILSDVRQSTKENVQRKQARTAGEREESDEEVSASDEEEEEESEVVYNPKNLPLGWDGKPIPYWLYKLHGLNITYSCEICGNAQYKGPKAFQRHFAEWRHAHGMRCLGIPNTAHFANVTQIEDALKLWQKLKDEKQREKFQPANEEEYEDSEGRVVNKKTYEDLKRQGLL